jgi:hypothetical protein
MKPHIGSLAVALITAIALTSTPATAQHRGGHSGGRVSAGVMHRGIHVGAGRQMSTGRMIYGRAVPRGRVTPHRRHLSVPGFALGIGVGAYRYPYGYGYYPYGFGYYPYGYSYYPYSYPAYYRVRVIGGDTITYRARMNRY